MKAGIRILIADDHSVTRRGLQEFVRDIFPEAEIHEASDAPGVLALTRAGTWNLLLLDILMPGGNLLEMLRAIREIDAEVPILMVTAAPELEYVIQSMKAGANGVAHKHLASEELVQAIQRVARGETYLHGDVAAAIARHLHDTTPTLPHHKLSERELDIFRRLALGRAVKEIAGDLDISAKTVATYVARIREKTGLNNHVEITRYALRNGLVD